MGLPIVYTAIFGNYDVLLPPLHPGGATWKAYADTGFRAPRPWKVSSHRSHLRDQRHSRYCKINSHILFPDDEITIWHDGNIQLTRPIQDYVDLLKDGDFAMLRHSIRSCIYEEAKMCKAYYKAPHERVDAQMRAYREDGFPEEYGLHVAFIVVRRNTPFTTHLNEVWWREVAKHTVRDQLSFNYCLWKEGIDIVDIPPAGGYYKRHRHIVHKRIRYR